MDLLLEVTLNIEEENANAISRLSDEEAQEQLEAALILFFAAGPVKPRESIAVNAANCLAHCKGRDIPIEARSDTISLSSSSSATVSGRGTSVGTV
ncbi:predicted protein [Uncinocarpus reesii 1704]|uniref:Uncharacterized protein n=1 Tax=Uncinocarpus reesii (strain UAMH 1704) TaxID=336963 RepID=C4JKC7_UNCRE|nr:uncharacterized protein UREG_02084 [Uncinocarpus reesii 1704]EEP77235.1 predicted protein [Uncinocarpus reesii 1704]